MEYAENGAPLKTASNVFTKSLAKWNRNTWAALVSGITGVAYWPEGGGTDVHAGGAFTPVNGNISNYFARFTCSPITLSPNTLANGAVGSSYTRTLTASPAGSYTFSIINGKLPKGLTLSTGGVISGTPTEFGLFTFTVMANTGTCMGSRAYTLTVTGTACATPSFTNRADFNTGGNPQTAVTADFNRDGNLDLAVSNLDSDDVTIFLGNGMGAFPTTSTITTADLNGSLGLAAGDFNGDGNPDFVAGSRFAGTAVVFFATAMAASRLRPALQSEPFKQVYWLEISMETANLILSSRMKMHSTSFPSGWAMVLEASASLPVRPWR